MANSPFDSIFINGQSLRPAPFISTSYEYNQTGEYVIGGFLIVTLSGTIIGEDIAEQINTLSAYQTQTNCIEVIIGCSGGSQFLSGAGRIRSVTISPSDQPYLANYSMVLALETVDGKPAVEADEEFLKQTCLADTGLPISFLQNYSESLSIAGEGNTIASVDNQLQISKSYIKLSGSISMTSFMREVCGIPQYNGINNSIDILKIRAKKLMQAQACIPDSPLAQFNGWNRWLDTKSLSIDANGSIVWNFDLYLSKGSAKPYAWIDATTEDSQDQKQKTNTKSINGTIKGLSSANIEDYLADRVDTNERILNARTAYNALSTIVANDAWPSDSVVLTGELGVCEQVDPNDPCANQQQEENCLQRLSSTVKESPIIGEITFSAEYGPISACQPKGIGKVDFTIEESLPAARHVEYIIPGAGDSVVVSLNAPTPHKVTISARGQLQGCDTTKLPQLIQCVENAMNLQIAKLQGSWLELNSKKTISTYSYALSKDFIECTG